MCGISGVVGSGERGREVLRRMHAAIPHRGPDGEGFLCWRPGEVNLAKDPAELGEGFELYFGFRWLVVQDREPAACQPMGTGDGRYWIVFNGEIFNFLELREELERAGHRFETSSDTEVILAAWRQWGIGCLDRFEGMWAFLLLDRATGELIGSRDRFGIKPMFWCRDDGRLLFASEIKQLASARLGRAIPDRRHVHEFLLGRRARSDQGTSIEGIETVPAASFFRIQLSNPPLRPVFRRYWNIEDHRPRRGRGDERVIDREIEEAFRGSVRRRERAVVRLGILLSGGLDSSLIVSEAAGGIEGRSETVSLVMPDEPDFDESQWVEDVSVRFNTIRWTARITPEWVLENLEAVTRAQDEPLIASALLAQHRVLAKAKELGFTVILDGQGADEVFGGYFSHQILAWRHRLSLLDPLAFFRDTNALAAQFGMHPSQVLWRDLIRPVVRSLVVQAWPDSERYDWLDRDGADLRDQGDRLSGFDLPRAMAQDVSRFGLPPLLLYSDRNGMSNSIEVRLPYLDHRLVELAMQLPADERATPTERKVVLRRLARSRLPVSVLRRTDTMGFVTPEKSWLRGALRQRVLDEVSSSEMSGAPVDRRAVRRWVESFMAGHHEDFRSVWRLMALPIWLRELRRYSD